MFNWKTLTYFRDRETETLNCVMTLKRKPGLEFLILEPDFTLEAEVDCPKEIFLLFFGLNQLTCFPARF